MITPADLHRTAREYLRAARLLRTRSSYDAAVYPCGYAVEIALKARICKTLKWADGFPESAAEFRQKANLKTHDLEALLEFTAMQDKIKSNPDNMEHWAIVNKWNPEQRYSPRGAKTLIETDEMIQAVQILLRILL